MRTLLAVLAISLLAGCANDLTGKSQAYREVHERVFWQKLSGGGMDGSAQAWANLYAHQEAERQVGK